MEAGAVVTATRRKFDFRPRTVATYWPEAEWPTPETFEEGCLQDAVRSRRAQGLPPVIQDPAIVGNLATLWGKR